MMFYELKLENFQGPLDKLLELIEARRLEITEISLAEVTDDFLSYLRKLEKIAGDNKTEYLRLLADFIQIASRLVFIKSKSLLPDISLTDEEQAEIRDLENRLKLYKEFKPAMNHLFRLWRTGDFEFSRPYFLSSTGAIPAGFSPTGAGEKTKFFYPGQNLSVAALTNALQKIFEIFKNFYEEETVAKEIISIEEKIKEIINRIQEIGELSFRQISKKGQRAEMIAIFLAILHLAHERLIQIEQKSRFSDIMIKRLK